MRTKVTKTKKKFEKSFFENWSSDYDDRRNKSFLHKSKKNMALIIQRFKNNNNNNNYFLEIGLGTGEVFETANRMFRFSYGTDVSEGMVRKAHLKGKTKNTLFVSDGCNLPLKNNSFDFIICQDVIEHIQDQHRLILEIERILANGGVCIITTPNPIWAPILYIAEKLKLKVKEGEHKFIFLSNIIKAALEGRSCHIISDSPFMMLPLKTSLDVIVEPLSYKKPFSHFGFSQMCILTKC